MLGNAWNDFRAWAQKPFSTDMNVLYWFLFLGMLIVLLTGWRIVLAHISAGIKSE